MGSGQSSVKGIHIEQSDKTSQGPTSSKKRKNVTAVVSKDSGDETQTASNNDTSEKDAEIASLTKQLCESESQKLDLEDRIQALEEKIEYLNTQTLMTEDKPCDETLHVKDQYISKLEKEKADIETESNKMKQKLRRKIKQLNSQMAEFKQESHFEMMEFKDEIQRLTDENQRLTVSANSDGPKQSSVTENTPKLPGGEKMKLILELSEQVTEQGDKISKLEKKVKDRDQVIEELRVKLRNKTEYLTAVNQSGLSDRGDRNNNSARLDRSSETPVRRYWGSSSPSHSSYKSGHTLVRQESDVDDLFAAQGDCNDVDDDDFDNFGSMKKLSELLQGTKSDDSKARESLEVLNSDRQNSSNHLYQIVEETPGSGTGRDSGLGSAGKRETENTANNGATDSYLNWKESSALSFESEFSDSDSVTGLRSQTKVSSAPPKLQNQGSTKSKKKSHILKKHIGSEKKDDRPPRPSRAFVNSSENGDVFSNERISSSQKFLPVLSPVNVS